jgi:dTDP-glucose 4,6-dehydratase
MRGVVTGGAGFLGSYVCERLIAEGWEVVCLDSLITGSESNLENLRAEPRFTFERSDISAAPLDVAGIVDWVWHLASPASPPDYLRHPIETLAVGSTGTRNALDLARQKGAGLFFSSTSETYGDPLVNPQSETYWGNVNPVGPRSVYDESKRFAEALTMAYHRAYDTNVRITRIFNTYGPRMRRADGRAVPNFVDQAINGRDLTVHGDGSQTRSLCFVDDLIEGFFRHVASNCTGPVNIGNPEEVTVLELAKLAIELAGSKSDITFVERPVDDPQVRCPDIALARRELGWEPSVPLKEGLSRTIEWAASRWKDAS